MQRNRLPKLAGYYNPLAKGDGKNSSWMRVDGTYFINLKSN
jgi:hypothetical protein